MMTWVRRIRAAIGMGLIWAAAWGLAGGLLARVSSFDSDLPFPYLFAALGFATGIIFSGIAQTERRSEFQRASLWRSAGWGAVSGLLLSALFVVGAALRGGSVWREFLTFGPPLTMAGGVSAAITLAVARRGQPSASTAEGVEIRNQD